MFINTSCDREKIYALWNEAFEDDRNFVNVFLDIVQKQGKFFGLFSEDGELLCMLFMLDIPINYHGVLVKSAYMYACATSKAHRGKGLFKCLYTDVKNILLKNGYEFVFCVPQTAELFNFYENLGFNKTLCRNEILVSNDKEESKICFEEKRGIYAYEAYLHSVPEKLCCPIKSREMFEFSLFASEGKFYTFPFGYLIYDGHNICEIATARERLNDALHNAARFFKTDLKCYSFCNVGKKTSYAVLCELGDIDFPGNAYANMLMD